MHKKSKIVFLLASLGVILLASIPVFIILKGSYSRRLEGFVGEIGTRHDNIKDIDKVITLLYAAENDFRIYTLTKDASRATQYREELSEVSDLLEKMGDGYAGDSSLNGMLTQKKTMMSLVLEASLLSDSLWSQALYLEAHPGDFEFYHPGTKEVIQAPKAVKKDSAIVESYMIYRRKHKGLLGRIKDAILDNPDASSDSIRAVKMVGVSATRKGKAGTGMEWDSMEVNLNLWSTVLNQLNSARGGLREKDRSLLQSNEMLFNRIKSTLASMQQSEAGIIKNRDAQITSHTQDLLREFDIKKKLMADFIIILALIILFFIWQFYKNGETLLAAKRNAENFAHLRTTFAAMVSHEIRGLTHAINASVEALNEKQSFSRRKELLSNIKQSWESLLAMLNNILDYTRMEQKGKASPKTPFAPAKAIADVVNTLRVRAETKSLELKMTLELPESLTVLGNESRLKQILINLVGNAIKFTFEGTVSVNAFVETKARDETLLTVTVTDTGRGIEEKNLSLIFEEFQQIDADKDERIPHGSGLGLAIVKRIIDQDSGKIEVKSNPGKGSVFTFRIPYKTFRNPKRAPAPKIATASTLSGLRVLTVENELLHRKYLAMLLSKAKMKVLEASDGIDALRLLSENEIDIVLTDINMPEMTGIELTRSIRKLPSAGTAAIPVVALTGTISEDDIRQFEEAGITDYLVKPFTPDDLLRKLSKIVTPVSE